MHDIVGIEGLNVPGVFVASGEFVEAAQAQSKALGAELAGIFVPHPIQDRTDGEMRALADQALEAILKSVYEPKGSS